MKNSLQLITDTAYSLNVFIYFPKYLSQPEL